MLLFKVILTENTSKMQPQIKQTEQYVNLLNILKYEFRHNSGDWSGYMGKSGLEDSMGTTSRF